MLFALIVHCSAGVLLAVLLVHLLELWVFDCQIPVIMAACWTNALYSASHLPYNRNGFKFFTNAGGLGKADIKDILERASDIYNKITDEGLRDLQGTSSVSVKKVDYMAIYASDLVHAVRKAAGNIGDLATVVSLIFLICVFVFVCVCINAALW